MLKSAIYRIISEVFDDICRLASSYGIAPEVDVFSSNALRRLDDYWSGHSDAFKKFWVGKNLWINPPVAHLPRIVEKIYHDEARGIILIPHSLATL